MRFYGGSGLAVAAIVLCGLMPLRRHETAQKTVSGTEWEYQGSITYVNIQDEKQQGYLDLRVTATQVGDTASGDGPIIRFRTAFASERIRGGTQEPKSAVWIQTPGRYIGHPPTPHSLSYDVAMADELNLPRPFTKPLQVGQTRLVELPIFTLHGELLPLRQRVIGTEMVASRRCYRVERTATHPQALGGPLLLGSYKEWLWVDVADGTLLKYRGQAQLADPGAVNRITTVLQRTSVHSVSPAEIATREMQCRQLSDIGRALDANPFPGKEQAAEYGQMQEKLTAFQEANPGSPYRPVCSYLQETLARQMKLIRRDQMQADLVGKPTPEFALRDTEGKTHTLQELRGHVVLLNFCASWCGPCNDEAPQIETGFWQPWRGRGLVVLGVDTREENAPLDRARDFRDRHHLTYPVLVDTANAVSTNYRVQAIPVNVVVDGNGVIRYIATGFAPDALKTMISSLLKP